MQAERHGECDSVGVNVWETTGGKVCGELKQRAPLAP